MTNTDKLAGVFLSQLDILADENEKYIVAENMEKYGGGFVKALGYALLRADKNNTQRIKKAFPEYWEQYKTWGK